MLGFRTKAPLDEPRRRWVNSSFDRLSVLLGKNKLLDSPVVLPTPEYFPDPYGNDEAALIRIFDRVALYLGIDARSVELSWAEDQTDRLRGALPFWSGNSGDWAGLYIRGDSAKRPVIAVKSTQMRSPESLIATLAHEIGHIVLLGGGLIDRDEEDMEPLTDLYTVFIGFGIFTANAAFTFQQHQDNRSQGWSTQSHGYLSEETIGYSLARYAYLRQETAPPWVSFLKTNVRSYFRRSSRWLLEQKDNTR